LALEIVPDTSLFIWLAGADFQYGPGGGTHPESWGAQCKLLLQVAGWQWHTRLS